MNLRPPLTTFAALALATALLPALATPVAAAAPAAAAAVPVSGDIFVADTDNNRVVHVTAAGQSVVGSGFSAPRGIAIDWAGNVYVADTGNNRIVKLPADGSAQVTVGSGFNAPRGVTVAPNGKVWVADTDSDRVISMNADGSGSAILDTHRPYLIDPIGITADSDGVIVIVYQGHDKLFRHLPGGFQDEVSATRTASGGVAVIPNGARFLTDTSFDKVLNNNALPPLGTGLNNPEGVNFTAHGQLVVADTGNDRVVRMEGDGSGQVTVGSGFNKPSGVAVYAPPPTFTAADPPSPLVAGVPYSYTFETTAPAGQPAPVIRRRGTSLMPTGLTLDPATGTLAGTPVPDLQLREFAQGYSFLVEAANGAVATVVQVNLRLFPALFTAASPPTPAEVGVPYSYTFKADGAPAPTFTVLPGVDGGTLLPPGLTLDPVTGVLAGSPTTVGSYPFYVRATNAHGYVKSNHIRLNVEQAKTAQAITFSTSPPDPAAIGATHDIDATGGASGSPVTFSVHHTTTNSACTVDATTGVVQFAHAGSCVIAADQGGNADYLAAPQKLYPAMVVGKSTQQIAFTTSPPAQSTIGGTHDIDATGGGSGNPVTFTVHNTTTNNACTVNAGTGVVSFANAGSCVIAADQTGNGDYDAAPQKLYPALTVSKKTQSITFSTTPPAVATVGGSHDIDAAGGDSGNPVTYSVHASTSSNACTVNVSTGVVSFQNPGSCVIAADQTGNTEFEAAPQKLYPAMTVAKRTQEIAFGTPPPAQPIVGGSHDIDATGGDSGNPVTYSVHATTTNNACTVNATTGVVDLVHAGVCVIAADQAGNADYDAAPQKLYPAMTVAKAAQTVTFTTTPPDQPTVGGTHDIDAIGGDSGNPVTFSVHSSTTYNACTVNATTGVVKFLRPGFLQPASSCVIAADQAGNTDYDPAFQKLYPAMTVAKAQAITFSTTPPAQPTMGGTHDIDATGGDSGNPVTFSVHSSTTNNACTVNATTGVVQFPQPFFFSVLPGTCVIAADQAGNTDYGPAPQKLYPAMMVKHPQVIGTRSLPNYASVGSAGPLSASGGGSGNPVTFTSLTPAVCTVTPSGRPTYLRAGTCTLRLDQAGNGTYWPGSATKDIQVFGLGL